MWHIQHVIYFSPHENIESLSSFCIFSGRSFALKARGWSARFCCVCVELPGLLSELTVAPDLSGGP